MNGLSERLMEELNSSVAFTIPIGKGIPVSSSLAVTWGIMLVLVVMSLDVYKRQGYTGQPGTSSAGGGRNHSAADRGDCRPV